MTEVEIADRTIGVLTDKRDRAALREQTADVDVRYWHLADIGIAMPNVRFWG
jgi:hypothetical protein